MPKILKFDESRPTRPRNRRRQARQHSQGDARPQGPQRRHRQEVRGPHDHQRRGHDRSRGRLDDPFENMGAQLVKEVATKTNDVAGDGTTTATVLAQALVHAGLRNVAAGASPMKLKRGMEKAVTAAVESIRTQSREIGDKKEIAQVASISAADPSIGEVLADAIDKVGKDGTVTVEESNTFGLELEFTEGMQFDKGYLSPYFVTDPERQEAVLDDHTS